MVSMFFPSEPGDNYLGFEALMTVYKALNGRCPMDLMLMGFSPSP